MRKNQYQHSVIEGALRAMDQSRAAGADERAAMCAALNEVASTGCPNEYEVQVNGVRLLCGFGSDIEGEWTIHVAPGTDLSELLLNSEFAGRIDVDIVRQMERETERNAEDDLADRAHEMGGE